MGLQFRNYQKKRASSAKNRLGSHSGRLAFKCIKNTYFDKAELLVRAAIACPQWGPGVAAQPEVQAPSADFLSLLLRVANAARSCAIGVIGQHARRQHALLNELACSGGDTGDVL